MTELIDDDARHATTLDLIPWWVNGRLSVAEALQVEAHLAQCARCRAEAEVERRIFASVRQRTPVEYAPQVSYQKLWSRIEDLERDVPTRPVTNSPQADPASIGRRNPPWGLAAALLLGLGLGVITRDGWRSVAPDAAPQYRTATTSPGATGRPVQIRVVFAPAVTVDELGAIVRGNGLAIVDGPSASGVYGLAVADGNGAVARESLERLRADPRVRFAEIVAPATRSRTP